MEKTQFTLSVTIDVTQNWIDDGFDATNDCWKEEIKIAIEKLMPYAYSSEFVVTVNNVKKKRKAK